MLIASVILRALGPVWPFGSGTRWVPPFRLVRSRNLRASPLFLSRSFGDATSNLKYPCVPCFLAYGHPPPSVRLRRSAPPARLVHVWPSPCWSSLLRFPRALLSPLSPRGLLASPSPARLGLPASVGPLALGPPGSWAPGVARFLARSFWVRGPPFGPRIFCLRSRCLPPAPGFAGCFNCFFINPVNLRPGWLKKPSLFRE